MKRSRTQYAEETEENDDFNPVYPFDPFDTSDVPFVTPPFISSNGLQEKPPGVLALNYKDPIVTENGTLTLKLGDGIKLNAQGQLTASNNINVLEPLTNTSQGLKLSWSAPLGVKASALTLNTRAPLTTTDESLALITAPPITVESSRLGLATIAPLSLDGGGNLGLNLSAPLDVSNNDLHLTTETPLVVNSSGALSIATADPISVRNNALTLLTADPLMVSSNGLGISVTSPITVINGSLALSTTAPLNSTGSTLSLSVANPLTISGNTLTVSTGNGLQVSGSQLVTRIGDGLTFDNGVMKVNVAGGMRTSGGRIILDVDYPFDASNNLSLRRGLGLIYNQSTNWNLTTDISTEKGLMFSGNKIALNAGQGLTFNNGQLRVKLGAGLTFDSNNNIALGSSSSTPYDPLTLWTTPDPPPNCSLIQELDAKLTLCLTKNGSIVNGIVSLVGVKGSLLNIQSTTTTVGVHLVFDQQGRLNTSTPTALVPQASWGYRQGQSVSTDAVTNGLGFMPNVSAYPRPNASEAKSQMVSVTYLQGDTSKPITMKVAFNGITSLNGYSLTFMWSGLSNYINQPFSTPSCSFSYITQE